MELYNNGFRTENKERCEVDFAPRGKLKIHVELHNDPIGNMGGETI